MALVLLCAGGPLPASADDCPWWKPALACNCCYPWIAEYTAWKDSKPIVQYVPICSDCSWPVSNGILRLGCPCAVKHRSSR